FSRDWSSDVCFPIFIISSSNFLISSILALDRLISSSTVTSTFIGGSCERFFSIVKSILFPKRWLQQFVSQIGQGRALALFQTDRSEERRAGQDVSCR